MAIEDNASIYGTLTRHIDLMVDKWKRFGDKRDQGGRGFTKRDGLMEEEKGYTLDLRDRIERGNRGGEREWGGIWRWNRIGNKKRRGG